MSLYSKANSESLLVDQNESGAIMILFAILVLSMVTLMGLAIDAGNLYSARIGVQAAADAGALAAASLSALGRSPADVSAGGKEIAVMNLDLKGIDSSGVQDPSVSVGTTTKITVNISAPVSLYILAYLPSIAAGTFRTVSATAEAEVTPSTVSLMLDTSESMACPAAVGPGLPPCSCAPNCDGTSPSSRIAALKLAVLGDSTDPNNPGFLSYFDETKDRVSLILFGTGARTVVPMQPSGFNSSAMRNAIQNATAQGGTNQSDALYQAYLDTNDKKNTSYILFTDGAPTAARFFFTNGIRTNASATDTQAVGDGVSDPAIPGPWSQYDYLSWGVIRPKVDDPSVNVTLPNITYFYPPYIDGGSNGYWEPWQFAGTNPKRPPAVTVITGADPALLNTLAPWTALQDVAPLGGMEVYMPNGSTKRLGFADRWSGSTYNWSMWQAGEHLKLYADAALAVTDVMRQDGGVFYGVGYGSPAPTSLDPYQNTQNPSLRKDIFMNRATIDPCAIANFNPPFPGIPTINALAAGGISTGSYFPAASPKEMQDVFMRIARKIRMRMIK